MCGLKYLKRGLMFVQKFKYTIYVASGRGAFILATIDITDIREERWWLSYTAHTATFLIISKILLFETTKHIPPKAITCKVFHHERLSAVWNDSVTDVLLHYFVPTVHHLS